MAPSRVPRITVVGHRLDRHAPGDCRGDVARETMNAMKLKSAAQTTAARGESTRGGDHRGDGVRCVVTAVDIVEDERGEDDG